MARILDKDTRLIDVDFGPVDITIGRDVGQFAPTSVTGSNNGVSQIIAPGSSALPGAIVNGTFIQYDMVDLEFMTMNNEVMQPVEVSIQRSTPVPLGYHINGNNHDQMEEYIYVFSRPLNNESLEDLSTLEAMRSLGLDRSQSNVGQIGGVSTGLPSHAQTIYAEKRMYSYSEQNGASITNGQLQSNQNQQEYNTIFGMPTLDSVTTWGTLSAITGPSLHCYRVVIMRNQLFDIQVPDLWSNVDSLPNLVGATVCRWPPVNITFLCKDPDYSEGEYLTRLANAMNNIPEGGSTA